MRENGFEEQKNTNETFLYQERHKKKETKTIAKIPPPVFQFVKSPRNKNQYFKRCNPVRTMLFSLFSKTVTETDKSAKINLINKSQYPAKAKNTFQP